MQFKDYDANKIADKLKQVLEFEAKYGENTTSKGWKKWCNDINYRRNEWQWRQNLANWNSKHNTNNY
tara:strand:- start:419 stop:619 length:201 start_codon:yes stop_codon:yes gene_type:complete